MQAAGDAGLVRSGCILVVSDLYYLNEFKIMGTDVTSWSRRTSNGILNFDSTSPVLRPHVMWATD